MKRFIFVILLISVLNLIPFAAQAFSLGGPFGGRITGVRYCTCSFSIMLSISSPKSGTFIYQPGRSTLYKWYSVYRPGVWALGTSSGYSTCLVYSGTGCISVGAGPVITKIGTSK